jgi:hypothetical protein
MDNKRIIGIDLAKEEDKTVSYIRNTEDGSVTLVPSNDMSDDGAETIVLPSGKKVVGVVGYGRRRGSTLVQSLAKLMEEGGVAFPQAERGRMFQEVYPSEDRRLVMHGEAMRVLAPGEEATLKILKSRPTLRDLHSMTPEELSAPIEIEDVRMGCYTAPNGDLIVDETPSSIEKKMRLERLYGTKNSAGSCESNTQALNILEDKSGSMSALAIEASKWREEHLLDKMCRVTMQDKELTMQWLKEDMSVLDQGSVDVLVAKEHIEEFLGYRPKDKNTDIGTKCIIVDTLGDMYPSESVMQSLMEKYVTKEINDRLQRLAGNKPISFENLSKAISDAGVVFKESVDNCIRALNRVQMPKIEFPSIDTERLRHETYLCFGQGVYMPALFNGLGEVVVPGSMDSLAELVPGDGEVTVPRNRKERRHGIKEEDNKSDVCPRRSKKTIKKKTHRR